MASLHLVRSSEAVTVSIRNPEPVMPMRTVEHQQLMDKLYSVHGR